MTILSRLKESKARRCIEAALSGAGDAYEGVQAARTLREVGSERCVGVLCEALERGEKRLRQEAAPALAAIHQRSPDKRILAALNAAILHASQPAEVREAAVEALAQVVDVRRAGSLVQVLTSHKTPLRVRAAAIAALKKLHYAEVLERLVESALFGERLDPKCEIRRWAIHELRTLDDHEKLAKLYQIAHGQRRLRYRGVSDESGGVGAIVRLMAEVDPRGSRRFLNQMTDDLNPEIRAAAREALASLGQQD